ncbi:MAG: MFS transporter [Candidatus Nanopelagicales bacterium]
MPTSPRVPPQARRILLGNSLSAIGSGLTMPLLIVYLGEIRGLGLTIGGLVVAYIAVVSLVVFPVVGWASDRYGPKPVLMAGLLVEAAGVALLGTVASAPSAFLVGTIVALGSAMAWPAQSALLGRVTTQENRQRVFGIQFMLLNLGLGVGGIVSALVVSETDPQTFVWLYLADATAYLAYFAVLLTLPGVGVGRVAEAPLEEGGGSDPRRAGMREVLADRILRRVLLLAVVLLMSGYGALEVGIPVFITVINGFDVSWVGVSFAVNTFTIVAAQLLVLRLIKGRSRSYLMLAVALTWAMSWILMGSSLLAGPTVALILVLVASGVFALGETLWAPVAPSLVNDLAPEHLRGRYNSSMSLVWSLSSIIGPGIAGLMLGAGLEVAWILVLVAGCTAAAVMALGLRRVLSAQLDGRLPA